MRIRFTGYDHIVRVVGAHRWDRANGHVVEVPDATTITDLLSQPGDEFAVATDEPLLSLGLTPRQCAALALAGVATVAELAQAKPAPELAAALGLEAGALADLIKAAKAA